MFDSQTSSLCAVVVSSRVAPPGSLSVLPPSLSPHRVAPVWPVASSKIVRLGVNVSAAACLHSGSAAGWWLAHPKTAGDPRNRDPG